LVTAGQSLLDLNTLLEIQFYFLYEWPMEKVIEKFSNRDWYLGIIGMVILVLILHGQFLSSYMGI
jgi:hypothetical protein